MRKKSRESMFNGFKCLNCGYYQDGYCRDLDVTISDDYPVCSDENYNS